MIYEQFYFFVNIWYYNVLSVTYNLKKYAHKHTFIVCFHYTTNQCAFVILRKLKGDNFHKKALNCDATTRWTFSFVYHYFLWFLSWQTFLMKPKWYVIFYIWIIKHKSFKTASIRYSNWQLFLLFKRWNLTFVFLFLYENMSYSALKASEYFCDFFRQWTY